MSKPRFLADMDLNDYIVRGVLRRRPEVIFLKAREVGLDGQPDEAVLAFAAEQECLLVSHDIHTMIATARLRIASGTKMTGLLMVRQQEPIAAVIDDLLLIWSSSDSAEWINQIRFLPL